MVIGIGERPPRRIVTKRGSRPFGRIMVRRSFCRCPCNPQGAKGGRAASSTVAPFKHRQPTFACRDDPSARDPRARPVFGICAHLVDGPPRARCVLVQRLAVTRQCSFATVSLGQPARRPWAVPGHAPVVRPGPSFGGKHKKIPQLRETVRAGTQAPPVRPSAGARVRADHCDADRHAQKRDVRRLRFGTSGVLLVGRVGGGLCTGGAEGNGLNGRCRLPRAGRTAR